MVVINILNYYISFLIYFNNLAKNESQLKWLFFSFLFCKYEVYRKNKLKPNTVPERQMEGFFTPHGCASFCLCMHVRRLNTPAPLHPSTHLLLRRAAPLLHLHRHQISPPDLFFPPPSSCLLFTKVWLSISCGLRQQALMKRPLRKGDPN